MHHKLFVILLLVFRSCVTKKKLKWQSQAHTFLCLKKNSVRSCLFVLSLLSHSHVYLLICPPKLHSNCTQIAPELHPYCAQLAAKLRPNCGQIAPKLQPNCGQIAAILRPNCCQIAAATLQPHYSHITATLWPNSATFIRKQICCKVLCRLCVLHVKRCNT